MDLYNWAGIPEEKMTPLLSRQVFHTERMTIARLHNYERRDGASAPSRKRAGVGGRSGDAALRSGWQRDFGARRRGIADSANVPHMVEAMEDCIVTDLFAPRREDWISGDDSYLRK